MPRLEDCQVSTLHPIVHIGTEPSASTSQSHSGKKAGMGRACSCHLRQTEKDGIVDPGASEIRICWNGGSGSSVRS